MNAQVAADLRAAAEILRREGWTQGKNIDDEGCRCILGALACVATGGKTSQDNWELGPNRERFAELRAAVHDVLIYDMPPGGVVGWNDAPGRTAREVIAALEAAADAAEAQS